MISLLFMTENRQFHSFIIITMILIAAHDSVFRWDDTSLRDALFLALQPHASKWVSEPASGSRDFR